MAWTLVKRKLLMTNITVAKSFVLAHNVCFYHPRIWLTTLRGVSDTDLYADSIFKSINIHDVIEIQ